MEVLYPHCAGLDVAQELGSGLRTPHVRGQG